MEENRQEEEKQSPEELKRRILELEQEVSRLRCILYANGIPFEKEGERSPEQRAASRKEQEPSAEETPWQQVSREAYEREQAARIRPPREITEQMAAGFFYCFHGRRDVFALRSGKPSKKTGHYGYYTQCRNLWVRNVCPRCEDSRFPCAKCENQQYRELKGDDILAHLLGKREDCSDVIGVYPIRKDNTCWFMAFDFDDHDLEKDAFAEAGTAWMAEVNTLRGICARNGIPCLVERSRSGNGAHLWLFFAEAIPAKEARAFGFALLAQGAKSVDLPSFRYYDRMIPNQDRLTGKGLGNLVALPLQGRALKRGNSAFVDENWDAYPDQWAVLGSTGRVDRKTLREKTQEWEKDESIVPSDVEEQEEGENKKTQGRESLLRCASIDPEDADGPVRIIRSDSLYIEKENLQPVLRNTLRSLATYWNPEYFKNQARGFSNYRTPMFVYCGEETGDAIALPRGCREAVETLLEEAGIPYTETDERNGGRPIRVTFQGTLRANQQEAADTLLSWDNGILAAATGFGKTVVGAYLIAEKKVSTLILVHNTEILEHWLRDLNQFLVIDEPLPTYQTKGGRTRTRTSLVGVKQGTRDTMTGLVDVAMISSLGKPGNISPAVRQYGMVIMDECHHGAAPTMDAVLRRINARYVYGMTATPKRDDGQEKRAIMQFGDVRWAYTAKEHVSELKFAHIVLPRFTPLVTADPAHTTLQEAIKRMAESDVRNAMIVQDAENCVTGGRTPLLVTKRRDHAFHLAALLKGAADHVFVLTGAAKRAERDAMREEMLSVPDKESLILIATGQYIGEGFNFPRLDTLLLVMPISYAGSIEQVVGRLDRDYPNKSSVWVYDYVDAHLGIAEAMYNRRLRTYKKMGYQIFGGPDPKTGAAGYLFDAESWEDRFRRDLKEAKREILIASPGLSGARVEAFLRDVLPALQRGVRVYVATQAPEEYPEQVQGKIRESTEKLRQAGIAVSTGTAFSLHAAVFDGMLVWYGSLNLLSLVKPEDGMMRVESEEIAAELLAEEKAQEDGIRGGEACSDGFRKEQRLSLRWIHRERSR